MGHLIMSRYPITSAETVVLVEGNTTAWANPEVKAVNEFHNAFVGTTEYW